MKDKVVLVTGGTRGIGRGIAQRFATLGAQVVICGRTQPVWSHAAVSFVAADLREMDGVTGVFDAVMARHGRLDVLVNNAGGSPPAEAATASPRFVQKIVALNLTAPLWCAQAAYRIMCEQPEGGVIIQIASTSGLRASPGTAAYGAAKAGLINATRSLAVEWAPQVRVNAVSPGLVLTEQARRYYGDTADAAAAAVPLGRLATPDDVADACVYLASPAAAYVTGANLVLDGGGERAAVPVPAEDGS